MILNWKHKKDGFYAFRSGLFHDGGNCHHVHAQYDLPAFIRTEQKTIYAVLGDRLAGLFRYVPAGLLSLELELRLSGICDATADAGTFRFLHLSSGNASFFSDQMSGCPGLCSDHLDHFHGPLSCVLSGVYPYDHPEHHLLLRTSDLFRLHVHRYFLDSETSGKADRQLSDHPVEHLYQPLRLFA